MFETTLKSQAVSENSDVRFTCIITGNVAISLFRPQSRARGGCGDGAWRGWAVCTLWSSFSLRFHFPVWAPILEPHTLLLFQTRLQ